MNYNDKPSRTCGDEFDPTQATFVFFRHTVRRERVWPYILAGLALLLADWALFRYLCPDIHVGEVFLLFICSAFAGTFTVEAFSKLNK